MLPIWCWFLCLVIGTCMCMLITLCDHNTVFSIFYIQGHHIKSAAFATAICMQSMAGDEINPMESITIPDTFLKKILN